MTTTAPGQGIAVRAELLPVREQITYRRLRQYKYQLMAPYRFSTGLRLSRGVGTLDEWVMLSAEGELTFRRGYAWDGPSGPTIDTRNFMRGSLVHDGLYQLIREGLLGREYRKTADELLRRICCEDGMSRIRGFLVYWGVRLFAGWAARRKLGRPVLRAP